MGCNDSKNVESNTSNPAGPQNTIEDDAARNLAMRKAANGGKRDNVMNAPDLSDSNFKAPIYPKTEEQEVLIRNTIKSVFCFDNIKTTEETTLINAMQLREVSAKTEVITQGDPGDFFYIIESGSFSAFVDNRKVKDYEAGSAGAFFGELALAYNKPRAATVRANTAGRVFTLEANVFRQIIALASKGNYDAILASLMRCELLWSSKNPEESNLTMEQLSKLADVVIPTQIKAGEQILHKGKMGKLFYMIKSGHVTIQNKDGQDGQLADTVLGPGTYFGELALMRDAPRAADVFAKSDCELLAIAKDTFISILGPLQEVIDHNYNMRLLDSVAYFSVLTKKEKRAMYDHFVPERHEVGTYIFEQGAPGDKFYIVKEGQCAVEQGGKQIVDANTKEPVFLGKGNQFGANALMLDAKRNSSVKVTSKAGCELLSLTRKQFAKLVAVKDVAAKFKKVVEQQNANNQAVLTCDHKFSDLVKLGALGSGTFGMVTLVQHKPTKAVYALKAMLKSEIEMHKQQENVMNEKNCMIGCDHPFILRLFQTFRDSQRIYMLLEFVQGGELFSVLHPAMPTNSNNMDGVNNEQAMFYSAGVLLGIAYLHNEKNVAYRDMKPENCLIDSQGYPKLVDFGFAKIITSKSYTLCGTPEYLAPELVLGRGHTKAVDYWALGIMIYEMQAGYSPFSDVNMDQTVICRNIIKEKLVFPAKFDHDCKSLCKELLRRDVKDRLGNLKDGTDDIKNHKWFVGYDWKGYYDKKIKAPMVPAIKNITDTSHFDPYAAGDHVLDPTYKDTTNWDKDF